MRHISGSEGTVAGWLGCRRDNVATSGVLPVTLTLDVGVDDTARVCHTLV